MAFRQPPAQRLGLGRPLRRRAPVEVDGDLALPLHDQAGQPGLRLPGGGRHAGPPRPDPGIDLAATAGGPFEAVLADEDQPGIVGQHGGQEGQGPTADDGHEADPPHQPGEGVEGLGERPGGIGIGHDGGQGTVEVEEQGRPLRLPAEGPEQPEQRVGRRQGR